MKEILLIIFAFALVISGGMGVILPLLPGVPIAWLGMLLFAYATGFSMITWKILFVFLGLTIFTIILDLVAPLIGAKKYKATGYGIVGTFLGLVFGIILFGPVGIVFGPFLGAFIGEMFGGRIGEEAMESAKGTMIGILAGGAIKLAIVTVMLGYIVFALFAIY